MYFEFLVGFFQFNLKDGYFNVCAFYSRLIPVYNVFKSNKFSKKKKKSKVEQIRWQESHILFFKICEMHKIREHGSSIAHRPVK